MPPHDEHAFFDAFDAEMKGATGALSPWLLDGAPAGLAVYRNTIASGAVDALAATYATVILMTGEDWFRAAASEFAREHPPIEPSLLAYGATFPQWLARFPPAADAPYLAGIARLDWLWWQAWSAAEDELLNGAELGSLSPEMLAAVTLKLHPSVRIASFDAGIPSLWLAHQSPARAGPHELSDRRECILFIRTGDQVETHLVGEGPQAFLAGLSRGATLLEAAEAALAADPSSSLQHILVTGLALGLFTRLAPTLRN